MHTSCYWDLRLTLCYIQQSDTLPFKYQISQEFRSHYTKNVFFEFRQCKIEIALQVHLACQREAQGHDQRRVGAVQDLPYLLPG